jgi:DNA replication protein DnaC
VKVRFIAARIAAIPELFREASLDSYRARNPHQENAAAMMRSDPEGNFYMTGPYACGKTHLFYAQYREIASTGRIVCHVRSTRELLEELKKMELSSNFVSPVM